ncbi:MAG: response regulator [Pseudomonadota bacterium]
MPANDSGRVNLAMAHVLLIDASQHSLDILAQVIRGFGAEHVYRATNVAEAEQTLNRVSIDLIVIDPALKDGDGFAFLNALRRSKNEPNCYAPVILISGHSRRADVARARDTGASFFIVKPIKPTVLLERILWIGRDKRPFVEVSSGYCGPDRRFKFEGPPIGSDGRRQDDMSSAIGGAAAPNLSDDELSFMLKPQKVSL